MTLNRHSPTLLSFGLVGLALLAAPQAAPAALQLKITATVGGTTMTETLQQTSGDSSGDALFRSTFTNNPIGFDGFTIQTEQAQSKFSTHDLNINSYTVSNTNASGGTLTLELTEDAYTTPGNYGLNLTSSATVLGMSSGSSASFQSFAGDSAFDKSFSTAALNFNAITVNSTISPSTTNSGFHPAGPSFSITSDSIFNLGANGSVTVAAGDSLISTPEPSTIVLALVGLPVACLIARNRLSNRPAGVS